MIFQSDDRLVNLVKFLFGLMIFGGIIIVLYAYAYHKSYNSAKYSFTDSNTGQVIKISPVNDDMDKELSDAKFVSYDYITGIIVIYILMYLLLICWNFIISILLFDFLI